MLLTGMTWDHPRGHDPLLACAALWRERTGVDVAWDRRSLQDFESFPLEDLARRYDLLVIDHPHVGQVTAVDALAPLDVAGREDECALIAADSVGPSWRSYQWRGRQWALPIDAAAQVQAWRADLIDAPPSNWEDVLDLARNGLVQCPMRAPHSLMTIYTLAANLGCPSNVEGFPLLDAEIGARVVDMMRELCSLIDPICFAMDPIATLEAMAKSQSRVACAPLIYGYVSYAKAGFRPVRLRFADIPRSGAIGPVGSALGGAGIAVSAFSANRAPAIDFAFWLAGGSVQSGPYASAGGQPASSQAWRDASVNLIAAQFYAATRATLEGAWVRPRHNGYMSFQHAAAARLNEGLQRAERATSIVAAINALFQGSFVKSVENRDRGQRSPSRGGFLSQERRRAR
jgi:multiple sugar transport system substrate-binding protein